MSSQSKSRVSKTTNSNRSTPETNRPERSVMVRSLRRRLWKAIQQEDAQTAIRVYMATKSDYEQWLDDELFDRESMAVIEAKTNGHKEMDHQKYQRSLSSKRLSFTHKGSLSLKSSIPSAKVSKRDLMLASRNIALANARKAELLDDSIDQIPSSQPVLQSLLHPNDAFVCDDFYEPNDPYDVELLVSKNPPTKETFVKPRSKGPRFADLMTRKSARKLDLCLSCDTLTSHQGVEEASGSIAEDMTTLFHEACRLANPDFVRLLLGNGGNPNLLNGMQRTALHMVAGGLLKNELQYLDASDVGICAPITNLKYDSMQNVSSNTFQKIAGRAMSTLFLRSNDSKSEEQIKSHPVKFEPSESSVDMHVSQRMDTLLTILSWSHPNDGTPDSGDGTSINTVDARGRSALHYAAELGRTELCLTILNSFGVILTIVDDTGQTPGELAAENKHPKLAAQLEARALLYSDPYGSDEDMWISVWADSARHVDDVARSSSTTEKECDRQIAHSELAAPFCWFETWTIERVRMERRDRVTSVIAQMRDILAHKQELRNSMEFMFNHGHDVLTEDERAEYESFIKAEAVEASELEMYKVSSERELRESFPFTVNDYHTSEDGCLSPESAVISSDHFSNADDRSKFHSVPFSFSLNVDNKVIQCTTDSEVLTENTHGDSLCNDCGLIFPSSPENSKQATCTADAEVWKESANGASSDAESVQRSSTSSGIGEETQVESDSEAITDDSHGVSSDDENLVDPVVVVSLHQCPTPSPLLEVGSLHENSILPTCPNLEMQDFGPQLCLDIPSTTQANLDHLNPVRGGPGGRLANEFETLSKRIHFAIVEKFCAFHAWRKKDAIKAFKADPIEALQLAGVELSSFADASDRLPEMPTSARICLICFDEVDGSSETWIKLMNCDHSFCSECLEDYLSDCANSKESGVIIKCPHHECSALLSVEEIQRLAADPVVCESLEKTSDEIFVATAEDLCFCPHPRCDRIVRRVVPPFVRSAKLNRNLINLCGAVCTGCVSPSEDDFDTLTYDGVPDATYRMTSNAVQPKKPHRFCFSCGSQTMHWPVQCDSLEKWNEKIASELAEVDNREPADGVCFNDVAQKLWMKANTRPCPKCKAPIEKNDGCNHMTCTNRNCRFEFCWICREDWKLHNSATGGFFRCNRWQAEDNNTSSQELSEQPGSSEVNASHVSSSETVYGTALHSSRVAWQKSREMGHFLHNYRRWSAHAESAALERQMADSVCVRLKPVVSAAIDFHGYLDFDFGGQGISFIHAAFTELLECRSLLQHSYAFAFSRYPTQNYVRRDRISKRKEREKLNFEQLQSELEMFAEQMSDMVARKHLRATQLQIMSLTKNACQKRSEFTLIMLNLLNDQLKEEAERARDKRLPSRAQSLTFGLRGDEFDRWSESSLRLGGASSRLRTMIDESRRRLIDDFDDDIDLTHVFFPSRQTAPLFSMPLAEERALSAALRSSASPIVRNDFRRAYVQDWECSECTYINCGGRYCAICGTSRITL